MKTAVYSRRREGRLWTIPLQAEGNKTGAFKYGVQALAAVTSS